ncbi:hypothetical protein C8R46DRAFT_1055861 [Mycena filopes]|nr:hypothetical protein C8R46DRAFT_1055861 [Mycena filopes]
MTTNTQGQASLAAALLEKAALDGGSDAAALSAEATAIRHLTFWQDGFTFGNDNVFRPYNDPANIAILTAIQAGTAPTSIMDVRPGQLVEVLVTNNSTILYSTNAPLLIDDSDPATTSAQVQVETATKSQTGTAPANVQPGQPMMAERQGSFSGAVGGATR